MHKFFLQILKRALNNNNSFKKEKNELINKKQQKLYENANICYICKEKFKNKSMKNKKCHTVWDCCHYTKEYRGAAQSICNLNYNIQKNFQ